MIFPLTKSFFFSGFFLSRAHFYGTHTVLFQRRGALVPPFDTRQASLAQDGRRGEELADC